MRRKPSRKGDRLIEFLIGRVVMFFVFISFVEVALLNCINCKSSSGRNRDPSSRGALNSRLTSAGSGLQLDLGDRAKRCLSEHPAPAAYNRAEDALKRRVT
jgi:hypothetical protein